jgi:TorA maturation chaperone TorD
MRSSENFELADTYLLLATLLRLPTQELVLLLKGDAFILNLKQLVENLGFSQKERGRAKTAVQLFEACINDEEFTLSELRGEYTRLFDHPDMPTVHRYEGLFRYFEQHPGQQGYEGAPVRFINPAALDAERCYKKAGFARAASLNEPADSISAELEFMHNLYIGKLDALEAKDTEKLVFADECIEEFSRIHLGKWFMPFFDACRHESRIAFYQALGLFGGAFISHVLKGDACQDGRESR